MKSISGISFAMCIAMASSAMASTWDTFIIKTGATVNDVVVGTDAAKEFVIAGENQKAAWGTDALDGQTVGQITALSIDRLDDTTRFTAGSGPAIAPYLNIWVTNGSGKYAVIANEPSNPEWGTGTDRWNITWDILKTKTVKVYENADKSWLPGNGVGLKFADLAGFTIQAPSIAELNAGWMGLGGGAPRELGTNEAYGFNWVFGDTLSNYVSGDTGYIVANPTAVGAVPLPAAAWAGMVLLGSLVGSKGLKRLRRQEA